MPAIRSPRAANPIAQMCAVSAFVRPLAAVLERRQNHVGRHRRAPEHLVADRGRNRVQHRAVARADRRLADAARADRRLRIRQIRRRRT